MVISPPPNPSVDRFSVEAPCLPTPEEIEAIIEEARRHARRRRRRNATAAALLALVGVGIAVASSGGGTVQPRSSREPAPPGRSAITPVRLGVHNGPIGVYGYVGGVRRFAKRGRLSAFTVRCAADCGNVKGADWSGNGKLLVYSASCAFGSCGGGMVQPSHGIRVLDPVTGVDRLVVHGDELGPLSVTADGSRIVYADGHRLRTVPTDGSSPPTTIITSHNGWILGRPTWSPDGRWIAYALDGRVFTAAADGSDRRILAPGDLASWSPDGRWIAYLQGASIRLITPTGTRDHTLARPNLGRYRSAVPHSDLTWSPDGRKLALMVDNRVAVVSLSTGSVTRRAKLSSGTFMFTSGLTWQPIARTAHDRAAPMRRAST